MLRHSLPQTRKSRPTYKPSLRENRSGSYPGSGQTVTRTFDADERLASITDWLGNTTSFGYGPDSTITATAFPDNVDSYAYDNADQLTGVTISQASTTLATLTDTRDPNGLLASEAQTGLPGPATTSYAYTPLNQLQSAGSNSYSYDTGDNPTQLAGSTGYTYDNANQLTADPGSTYTYNQAGQRTAATPTTGPATTYAYDQAGRLTTVSPASGPTASYAYDGDGLRTSVTAGGTVRHFTWDQENGAPLTLKDGTNSYIYGPDDLPIEQISQSGTVSYLHHDQLGSTRLITDTTGAPTASYTYNPYGTLNSSSGTATTPFRYAGQYTDPQTGLQYLRARYYDPQTGQFLTPDPLEQLTRQPYAYVTDDPTNGTDPTGLFGLMDISDFAAGALNTLTGGVSTDIAGSIFGFSPDCANFGTAGAAGSVAAVIPGLFDGGDEIIAAEDAGNQAALRDLVNEVTNGGRKPLSVDDANTILEWGQESNYPGLRAKSGDVASPSNWKANPVPHIHVPGAGRGGHVPVEPGVNPIP